MFEDGGADSAGGHPVLDAAALVSAAAHAVLSSAGTSLTLAEVQIAATGLHAAAAQLDAARLHVTRLLLEREDDPARPGATTAAWLAHHRVAGRDGARADIAAARATDPAGGALPVLGAALAQGSATRAHVDVAVRALRRLPTGLVRTEGEQIDQLLTSHALSFAPGDAGQLAKHLLDTVAPDGLGAYDDEAHERRFLSTHTDRTGMVQVQGQLEPVGGTVFTTVLHHLASPDRHLDPPADADPVAPGLVDARTMAQRLADAQVEMAHLAAAHLHLTTPTLEPARVVIVCTPEQLTHPDPGEPCDAQPYDAQPCSAQHPVADTDAADAIGDADAGDAAAHRAPGPATCELTGPVSASTLHRHACDAVLDRVVLDRAGALLRMDSLGRLATRAQRRALAARDGGCAWPTCSAPPTWTEAHHITWWSRGGPTTIENLVLLCPRHHTEIHREHWTITMSDGVPWFVPPRWVDPPQTPVRNTLHLAVRRTRRAGQRLVAGQPLDADDLAPPAPPPTADPPVTSPPPPGAAPPAHERHPPSAA